MTLGRGLTGALNRELAEWTIATRVSSLKYFNFPQGSAHMLGRLLCALLIVSEEQSVAHLDSLLPSLLRAAGHALGNAADYQSREALALACECARVIGAFIDPSWWVRLISSVVQTSMLTTPAPGIFPSSLLLLSYAIRGASAKQCLSIIPDVVDVLQRVRVHAGDDPFVTCAIVNLGSTLLRIDPDRSEWFASTLCALLPRVREGVEVPSLKSCRRLQGQPRGSRQSPCWKPRKLSASTSCPAPRGELLLHRFRGDLCRVGALEGIRSVLSYLSSAGVDVRRTLDETLVEDESLQDEGPL